MQLLGLVACSVSSSSCQKVKRWFQNKNAVNNGLQLEPQMYLGSSVFFPSVYDHICICCYAIGAAFICVKGGCAQPKWQTVLDVKKKNARLPPFRTPHWS